VCYGLLVTVLARPPCDSSVQPLLCFVVRSLLSGLLLLPGYVISGCVLRAIQNSAVKSPSCRPPLLLAVY
jgi:hypothetical protein